MKFLTVNDIIQILQKVDEKNKNKLVEFITTEGYRDFTTHVFMSEYFQDKNGILAKETK